MSEALACDEVRVPAELLRELTRMAEQSGDPDRVAQALAGLPNLVRFAPHVDLGRTINELAKDLGCLLANQRSPKGQFLFLRAGDVVTVEEKTGEMERMTPGRFVGWVEQFTSFRTAGRARLREGLTRDDAALVLEQDVFRDCLRPLTAVHTMTLPVRRESGQIDFLPAGYDAESGIFTAPELTYPMNWTWEDGQRWLEEHYSEFPWAWPDGEKEEAQVLAMNRSYTVAVFALVGAYCRALFPPGTPRPIILVMGNQPGTGKTRLIEMALMPTHGEVEATDLPKEDAEMKKTLETQARVRAPFVFFDDIGGGIYSNSLYKFATASSHGGRKMGGNSEVFREPNVTQVFATGNDLKFDANLARRTLVAELFLATEVRGRKFKKRITIAYLRRKETRQGFLAACCALVRNYIAVRETLPPEHREHPTPLESFEEFTGEISMMMQAAGFNDPLVPAELAGSGAEDEDEMKELLVRIASEAEGDEVFDRKELVEKARQWGLIEGLVGTKDEKDLDSTAMKRFGRQLQKHRGREYRDDKGRRFRFSHRHQRRGATYPLTFIVAG